MKKKLKYSVKKKAAKFFKKHPKLEINFKEDIVSIAKGHTQLNEHDIKLFKGLKNGFRYRKGDKRIVFLMTADYEVIAISVENANNRGDIYK